MYNTTITELQEKLTENEKNITELKQIALENEKRLVELERTLCALNSRG